MNKPRTRQRRTALRSKLQHPVRMYARALPQVAGRISASRVIAGDIQNISGTGLCLLTRQHLKISELLVAEIGFPGTQASVPTLLQVRWIRKTSFRYWYRTGLHFVIQPGMVAAPRTPGAGLRPGA